MECSYLDRLTSVSENPLDDVASPDSSRARARRKGLSGGQKALIGVLCLLLLVVGGGATALWWAKRTVDQNIESLGDPFEGLTRPTPSAGTGTATQEAAPVGATNFLVLGSDSRISAGDPSQWEWGAQRTDTIMLVQVPEDRKNIFVMSIPRDSWVDIPGYGQAKINAAFSFGGPSLLIQTVEDLTGVLVDHFVVTDFEAFQRLTDDLGGVNLTLKSDFTHNGVTIPAGQAQQLNGDQALRWVRERKTLPRGDFDRMQRQQAWVRAIAAKIRNGGVLNNPIELNRVINTVSKSIAADDGLTSQVLFDLAVGLRGVATNDIVFFTAPYTGTGRSADGQSIIELNFPALDSLMQAWREDDLGPYLEAHKSELDSLPAVVN